MKEFKFLKNTNERSYSNHLRAFLDEDEYSFRSRMVSHPGSPERLWIIKKLLVRSIICPYLIYSTPFPWGIIRVVHSEIFTDEMNNPCLRGMATVTEINRSSYYESIIIFADEYADLKQTVENENDIRRI